MTRLTIWGAGELGGRVAERWHDGPIIGITQTTRRHSSLQAMGVEARIGSAADILLPSDLLLLAIPGYANQGEALAQILHLPAPRRAVLISSTGYYGASASGFLTAQSSAGTEDRAQAIAAVERTFLEWTDRRGVIIRFGGLHRSGRGPITPLARRKAAPLGPPNRLLTLIHYDDAATATVNALKHPDPQPIYIGFTNPSPTRRDYYEAACRSLNLSPPEFTAALANPPQYDIAAFQRDLLPQVEHPDWQEALQL